MAAARRADCCLSLGSTMSIGPSNRACLVNGPLVVCVRQDTEFDRRAAVNGVRAYGDCDAFMREVMRELLGEAPFGAWVASLVAKRAAYDARRPPRGSCKRRGDIFVKKF